MPSHWGTGSRVMRALVFSLVLLVSGCASEPLQDATSQSGSPAVADRQGAISGFADELRELAQESELWITPTLTYLATVYEGDMVGLDFRFKSRDSTMSKIESRMLRDHLEDPRDVSIRDSLRYTMRFKDLPSGHHGDSVAGVLALMEHTGHQVLTVKNFWPRGDDYSGINTTLRAPNGLAWELQFHTPASFDLKMSSHVIYEQVRAPDATIELRRSMYDEMVKQWDRVPAPAEILEPASIHPVEEIIIRPRP